MKKGIALQMEIESLLERNDIPDDAKKIIREFLDKQHNQDNLQNILIEKSIVGIVVIQEGYVKYVNQTLSDISGYTYEEIINKPFKNLIHPKSLPEVINIYERRLANENLPIQYNMSLLLSNGRSLDVEVKSVKVIHESKPTIVVFISDFSRLKKEFDRLEENERLYRTIITTASEGVWVTDLENRTLYVNPALERMLGWTQEELIGKRVEEFLSSNSQPLFSQKSKERYTNGISSSSYELTLHKKDGTPIKTRVSGTALYDAGNKIMGSFGLLTDITDQALDQERIKNLIEFNPDAITVTDLEFNIILVNSRAVELYGAKSTKEIIGLNALEFIIPEQRQKAIDNALKTLHAGKKKFVFEHMLTRLDGTTYPAELFVSAIEDSKGNPTSFIAITRDITERKRAEQKIIESERKYRTLVENINTGIFRVHVNKGLIQCNRAFCEMFGYDSFEEISCRDLSEIYVNPNDRNRFVEELYLKGELYIKEVLMKRKDGSHFWASISSRVSPSREWHDGIIEDISKKKYAEQLLKQVKSEEEMFHAMLTHFVRNDLQKIVNNLDYLLLKYESTKGLNNKDVNEIIRIATRSSEIIDTVNKIFEVLQTPFKPESIKKEISVLELINLMVAKFDLKTIHFEINHKNLDFKILYHEYIEQVISEIARFLVESRNSPDSSVVKIVIDGLCFEDNFCIIIQNFDSDPIPTKVCERLVAKITEKWEYHGHYIGLSLVSVIMNYFKGQLRIHPSMKKGNEFQLWFPQSLLRSKC